MKLTSIRWQQLSKLATTSMIAAAIALSPLASIHAGQDVPGFHETLKQALDYSLNIKAQGAAVAASNNQVYGAYGNWLPRLNATTGNTNHRFRYKHAGTGGDRHYRTHQFTLDQSIFNGGKNIASLKYAKASERLAESRQLSTINQSLLEAIDIYINLYKAVATGKITANRVELLKKHQKATETKLKLGSATKTELAETVAEVAAAEADHAASRSEIERLRAEYLRITNTAAPNVLAEPVYCDKLPQTITSAMTKGETANPNILAAKNQHDQAKANVFSAKAELLPKASFNYTLAKSRYNEPAKANNLSDYKYGFTFSIPILQGGTEYASIRQNTHLREQSRYNAMATHDMVKADITARWHNLKTMNERFKASQAGLKAAKSAYNGAKAEFENGLRNNIDFLNAEQNLFQAQLKQIVSQGDDILAGYQLLAATGQLTPEYLGLK